MGDASEEKALKLRIADIPKQALITLIRAYKSVLSPLLPASCRYVPTCSEYAIEAIDRHGIVLGALLAGWRLLRCHPFAHGGFDPVPFAGKAASPPGGRDWISRAPGSQAGSPVAFWDGGRSARAKCGAPAGREHSAARPCSTH